MVFRGLTAEVLHKVLRETIERAEDVWDKSKWNMKIHHSEIFTKSQYFIALHLAYIL